MSSERIEASPVRCTSDIIRLGRCASARAVSMAASVRGRDWVSVAMGPGPWKAARSRWVIGDHLWRPTDRRSNAPKACAVRGLAGRVLSKIRKQEETLDERGESQPKRCAERAHGH